MPRTHNAIICLWPMILLIVSLSGCRSYRVLEREVNRMAEHHRHHAGFLLYDPGTSKPLASLDADKYFTPASNVKILTLYAGLTLMGDSVPAIRYQISNDSLLFSGTGDPSLLNPDTYNNPTVWQFIRSFPGKLWLAPVVHRTERYGPGWSWDDYDAYYQPERNGLPVYGNVVRIDKSRGRLRVVPPAFSDSIILSGRRVFVRERMANRFFPDSSRSSNSVVPFITSDRLTARLLSDTLGKPVGLLNKPLSGATRLMKSVPSDSLFKTMMQASDNFIAEQILMMASFSFSDTLDPQPAIRRLLESDFSDLPQRPIWVDGSGLSRYNQITPASVVAVWEKLYRKVPKERLFKLLASSGRPGTLRDRFGGSQPLVFGKTGTLSNNYSLSGFLVTKRGRLLIFSFMNANFTAPTRIIRDEVDRILTRIHEKY